MRYSESVPLSLARGVIEMLSEGEGKRRFGINVFVRRERCSDEDLVLGDIV